MHNKEQNWPSQLLVKESRSREIRVGSTGEQIHAINYCESCRGRDDFEEKEDIKSVN